MAICHYELHGGHNFNNFNLSPNLYYHKQLNTHTT
jgi:hypothetical protein